MRMYVNESSGESILESQNVFPAEHYNVTVNMGTNVTPHNCTADYINEGKYSQRGWKNHHYWEISARLLLHSRTENII